jgi:hypothetical protein
MSELQREIQADVACGWNVGTSALRVRRLPAPILLGSVKRRQPLIAGIASVLLITLVCYSVLQKVCQK